MALSATVQLSSQNVQLTRRTIGSRRQLSVSARRTVRESSVRKPSFVLDKPTRLWEIGSSYWFPFSGFKPPSYLDGSLPGDRGFDPFSLGATWGNPPTPDGMTPTTQQRLGWLLEGELYNGRLAMLAVVGILTVDLNGDGEWWTAPYRFNWPFPYAAAVIIAHLGFALLEKRRLENYAEKGEAGHFGVAPFDPLVINDDYKRQAEVRNARLAMLTVLGYATQAWVTGLGPIECAVAHLKDPLGANIFTYGDKGLQVVITFLFFSFFMHVGEWERSEKAAKKPVRA